MSQLLGFDDPEIESFCRENHYVWGKRTATGAAFVSQMIFNARINVGTFSGVDDAYCYDSLDDALSALAAWDGVTGEPQGWKKHVQSGRRRPGGDPAKEYVAL